MADARTDPRAGVGHGDGKVTRRGRMADARANRRAGVGNGSGTLRTLRGNKLNPSKRSQP